MQTLLQQEGLNTPGSRRFSVQSLHVPHSEDMHLADRWVGDPKLTLGLKESANDGLFWVLGPSVFLFACSPPDLHLRNSWAGHRKLTLGVNEGVN